MNELFAYIFDELYSTLLFQLSQLKTLKAREKSLNKKLNGDNNELSEEEGEITDDSNEKGKYWGYSRDYQTRCV